MIFRHFDQTLETDSQHEEDKSTDKSTSLQTSLLFVWYMTSQSVLDVEHPAFRTPRDPNAMVFLLKLGFHHDLESVEVV